MADQFYNKGVFVVTNSAATNAVDWVADTIKLALVTATYTFNPDHNFFSEITNELSGTGYTAGGNALASKTAVEDDALDRVTFDAADLTFSAINAGTPAAGILYKDTTVAATSPLIMFLDSNFGIATNGSDLVITWDSAGIFRAGNGTLS